MLKNILSAKNVGGSFSQIINDISDGKSVAVFGTNFSNKCHIVSQISAPTLYIVKDTIEANKSVSELQKLYGEEVVYLNAKFDTLIYKDTFIKDNLYNRLTALYKISKGCKKIVTTIESLYQLYPKKILSLTFKKGEEYNFNEITLKLVKLGYKRVDFCENKGEFSIRGDIVEIFAINLDKIYRLDFFGDFLEEIRGEESENVTEIDVVMVSDVIIESDEVEEIKNKIKKSYKKYGQLLITENARSLYNKLSEKLDLDLFDDSLQYLFPIIRNSTNVFSLLDENIVVCYDESKVLYDNLTYLEKEHITRCENLFKSGNGLDFIENQYIKSVDLIKGLTKYNQVALQSFKTIIPFFSPLKTYSATCSPLGRYSIKPDDLISDSLGWILKGYRVLLCARDIKHAEKMYYFLKENKIISVLKERVEENFSGIVVSTYELDSGFIYHDSRLVVIGTNDLFFKAEKQKTLKRKRGDMFTAPAVGDFAVHENFGIGLVKGVKRIATIEGSKDYIELEYYGGDRLYVATDQMDKLSKYLGGSEKPTLNRIGNLEFERIKERARASISKMTINLKKLYKERKEKKGFSFSPNNALTEEFNDAFEFELTPDQAISMQEIYDDMESDKVMDRLLCGDVGFGKTELAFRACFKAILDCKQTAIITPTTILSQQHFITAKKRFEGFGVRIECLNRFKTAKQQEIVIEKLKNGDIDLIIGTHRIFSKDIVFKDLGLLVIDEEQRFGVEHKEKLKLISKNVDTLTLSATPIPRTLHMSLSGIRDISIINTPPKSRIPVQTVVSELTDSLIVDAVNRELSRNGQVFILYNRVESIYSFAKKVQDLIPNAKIIVANGQMAERELERNVTSFYEGKGDILIATTIIENGIDIVRANTLIVESADRLGLSTLYQLKGRVGRSDVMAYAYFTYTEGKLLSESAYKRLSALMEYTEMGSGYKIAMRDLEIRGAGNVLGKEQHGHLDRIGYELYNKLLKEELGEVTKNQEVELDIKIDAYIPEKYIASEKLKMEAYKQIAEISSLEDYTRIVNTLTDNFGELPIQVKRLIDIAWLKVKLEQAGAIKVVISNKVSKVYLKDLQTLKDGKIVAKLNELKGEVSLTFEEVPILVFTKEGKVSEDYLKTIINFLTF